MERWITKQLCELSNKNFDLLLEHKIPGIIIKNFVNPNDCELLAERLKKLNFGSYDHLKDIPVHQLGVCQNQFANEPKSVYFDQVSKAKHFTNSIFDGVCNNPIDSLLKILNDALDRNVGIFEEPEYGPYFAGAFRSFSGHGRLHADHAPSHVKTDWAITKISKQLTWNLYYCLPNTGGEVVIYDTVHTQDNDVHKVPGQYYFPYSVLENNSHIKVRPDVGDLIIFNTQNFHEILGNEDGRRISQTSFMGIDQDGSLKIWS